MRRRRLGYSQLGVLKIFAVFVTMQLIYFPEETHSRVSYKKKKERLTDSCSVGL